MVKWLRFQLCSHPSDIPSRAVTTKQRLNKPSFIVSTDVSPTTSTIIEYYQNRWDVEVTYRYHKNSLGFDEYQVESLTSIKDIA